MNLHGTWRTAAAAGVALAACGDGDDLRTGPDDRPTLSIAGGGHNVTERFTSDLWVHGRHAYTGTWGGFRREGNPGNALEIWALDAAGAPSLADSLILPGVGTVSDVEVSADGGVLMLGTELGERAGL